MALDPEKIDRLLEGDIANIVAQIGRGKPLSQAAIKRLESYRAAKGGEPAELTGLTNQELADYYGISISTVKRDLKAGLPVRVPADYRAAKAGQQKRPESLEGGDEADAAELPALKARKLRGECERIEFWLAVDQGQYLPVARVREDLLRIAGATRAAVMELESTLPPLLEGLAAPEMQVKIRERVDRILGELADRSSELYQEARPPEPSGDEADPAEGAPRAEAKRKAPKAKGKPRPSRKGRGNRK